MSRDSFFGAAKTNLADTGLTAWYGLIGASVSVGAPIIGTMNPALAGISLVIPLFARWNQTAEILGDNDEVRNGWRYYSGAVIKALVNIAIFAATYAIGMAFGQTACFLFLVAFCASKFLNLGDASPIQHIEHFWSGKTAVYPEDRTSLISSLGANFTDTMNAIYYGLVSTATQFPLPLIGQLTLPTAGLLFSTPFIARANQIRVMTPDLADQDRAKYHRAKAMVSTAMNMLVGLGLFATASLLQLDKIAILAVLTGWASAKLTSGGENSPLNHMQGFFNRCAGGNEAPRRTPVVEASVVNERGGNPLLQVV